MVRDKEVQSPSRSCDEPGRRRFCWLGNLQGAGAFAAKQAYCSRESSNVSGASTVGRTDLASTVVGTPALHKWTARGPVSNSRHGSHREPHAPSEEDVRCRQDKQTNSNEMERRDGRTNRRE